MGNGIGKRHRETAIGKRQIGKRQLGNGNRETESSIKGSQSIARVARLGIFIPSLAKTENKNFDWEWKILAIYEVTGNKNFLGRI